MARPLRERIAAGRQALVDSGIRPDAAAVDADVLARHVLGWERARLVACGRDPEPAGFGTIFMQLIARRINREPVALITGHKEFWGLDFTVTRATLIPRPETELIVEEALRRIPAEAPATILDIGTGTGCLAVALAHERPRAAVVATDISQEALLVARCNAQAHGVSSRVRLVRTDLAAGLRLRADLVVSNPPYVPDEAAPTLSADVFVYEPFVALFGGEGGMHVIRQLLAGAHAVLAEDGSLIVEFGDGQEDAVRAAAEDAGWRVERVLEDLQGIARTVVLRR